MTTSSVIEVYSEAKWNNCIKDSSRLGICVYTRGSAISWKSSKQIVIAKSTMESEFIALDKCGEKAKWIHQFVENIPRCPKPVMAIKRSGDASKGIVGRKILKLYQNQASAHDHDGHTMRTDKVRLSSPAVQQLWTLYPGKQTTNLF
ncbi:hypothetical protein Tco_0539774 [Tanacetum coccineum]